MKRIAIVCWLYFNALYAFAQEPMSSKEASDFRDKVISKTATIQNMQSEFEQRKHLDFLANAIKTYGKMHYQKPNKLSWEYTKPYQYRIVFAQDKITITDNGKVSQVKADDKVFKKINNLIVSSVNGNVFDEKEFDITYWFSAKKAMVKLRTKEKILQRYITEIQLTFSEKYLVEKVKLIESSSDYTEILFKNTKINQ
ncbi:LolA family protein [Capnocytophaga catalasegens]|uniref:Cell envelope biogenesis protein LolA n=1 Tax=Capnocytophaga catalasegens TaxID=1004260 RepID=A0AAV5AVQ3_9FLAO|nr:outer membrane lipoprotein carrier protein LolA [Capnocytophaga catalasegens]GIZ14344.1 cell envelope biogenesis protein LolA [Capnocytophaga catalasegens]GJM51341.1 cell envelope biogenesis protein LolA [Capnocytophaga catalasegens]GJM53242.1 cell envelope biogenesis protein LolA [Capnocytophaga catalasegens]